MAKPPKKQPKPEKPPELTLLLPMQLQIGDRLTDETREYEVIGRPYNDRRRENRERACQENRVWGHDDPNLGRARTRHGEARDLMAFRCAVVAFVLLTAAGCSSVSICVQQEKGVSASEDARNQAGCAPSRPTRGREREQEMRDGQARSGIANRTEKLYQRG